MATIVLAGSTVARKSNAMSLRSTFLLLFTFLFAQTVQANGPPAAASNVDSSRISPTADASADGVPTAQVLYQLLLAEIAAQRGQWGLATAAYLDLAKTTHDARIARRAAEMGLHSKQYATGIEAGRLWLELAPNDPAASVVLASFYVATQKTDELSVVLQKSLTAAGPEIGPALLRLNRVLARYNDKTAVMQLIEQVTVPYLNIAEARFVRAQAAANAKDGLRTQAEIDQALALKPDWEMAALFKFQQLPSGAPALTFAEDFLARHAEAKDMRLAYARGLVAAKRYTEARQEFRRLRAVLPESADIAYAVGVLALQLNDATEAEAQLKEVIALGDGRADSARFYLGQIAEFDQRVEEAIRWYREVSDDEQRLSALLRGTQLLVGLDRLDEAREWLTAARAEASADAPRLYLAEIQLLRDKQRYDDVQQLIAKALVRFPENTDLIYEAGLNAERLGDVALLEKHFRHLIALKPDSPQGYNALGYSFADRAIKLNEAEQLIDKAMALAPDDHYILDSKGWVLFRMGRLSEALEFLRRAYAKNAEPEIAAHIGEVLWAMGERSEAEALWRAADKAHPGNGELAATIKRFLP